MRTPVIMPALGMTQETGTVLEWHKAEGQPVAKGEILVEIETDKTTFEMEAPATGILFRISAPAGQEVPVGVMIGEIQEGAEDLQPAARRPASPKARRLAAERGIDLAGVAATGPDGAVLAVDLSTPVTPSLAPPASSAAATSPVPHSNIWRIMAQRTAAAWSSVPHFYLVREVTAVSLVAWRDSINKRSSQKVTYTDLLVKLIGAALREHPGMRSRWVEDRVEQLHDVHVGMAVAVEEGLVVPVIRHADRLGVSEICAQRTDLIQRAQSRKLRPEDVSGAAFTLSNLGMYGVDGFQAIVNAPEAAILAVGRIAPRVIARGHQAVVEPTIILNLSCDHRVVDGARAAKFLTDLADLIEEPLALLERPASAPATP